MIDTLHGAVNYRDIDAVRRLAQARTGMEARDEIGATPLISATSSDQYLIAEVLLKNGADIWAHTKFGVTAGRMAEISKTPLESEEGRARQRVIDAMAAHGFHFPAYDREKVLQMVRAGQWGGKASATGSR